MSLARTIHIGYTLLARLRLHPYNFCVSGTTAFGKPLQSGLVGAIMNAPSLNQAPSVANPETVPANDVAMKYAQLLAIATDLMQIETDGIRKMTLAENVAFFERAVRESLQAARSGGAPAPITPPMPQAAPAGPPQPAAMGAPPGMAPPSPQPPGAGGIAPQGVPNA